MKKTIALFTLLFAFSTLLSQNRFHYGANLGISSSMIRGKREAQEVTSLKEGISVLYNLKGRFQLQGGVNYLKKGYTIYPNVPDANYKIRTSNIEIPIGLRMRLGRHYIGTGILGQATFHPTVQQNEIYLELPKNAPNGAFAPFQGTYASYFWQFHQAKNGFMELGIIGQSEGIWNPLFTALGTGYYSLNLQLAYYFSPNYEKYKPLVSKPFRPGYVKRRK